MRLDAPQFRNKICKKCIEKNIAKYGSFDCKCDGITIEKDIKFAMKEGVSEHDARFAYDPSYFFEHVYGSKPRWYQEPILKCTSRNLISRQCRQSGKTLAVAYKIMHYVLTNENKTVIILTPQEKQIKKIWDEYIYRDCLDKVPELKKSIVSSVQKPYYQVTFDNGSKIILMVANEGARGQCLPAGSLVTLENGSQIEIKDIKLGDSVLTFDDKTKKLLPNKVRTLHKNGIKNIFEITTESGRKVRATGNHPFFINGDWKDTDKIVCNDLIAIPKIDSFGTYELESNIVKYIAYMIGDGTCSSVKSTSFKFTVNNNTIMKEFLDICRDLDIKTSIHQDNRRENLFNIGMSAASLSSAMSIMKEYNLLGKYCDTKSIPWQIESISKDKLKLFINRLYSTDGWVSWMAAPRNAIQAEIGYCTTSEKLATQLQYLLQRFGIKSRIQTRSKSLHGVEYKKQYIVKIRDKKEIYKFLTEIGPIFGKEEKSREVFNIVNHKKFINQVDKTEIGDIYYEKVVGCNIVSEEETYNLTVENTHTFIVNGIVTHNTADWIYIDEAAIIGTEMLNSILLTVASRGEDAVVIMTSTPKGRGNIFYKSCKEDSSFNEYHIGISVIEELRSQVARFKKMLGETGFIQECEAEFPDVSGGPFNLAGIAFAKGLYEYESCIKEPGYIYFGGVDWNGPSVGTYFYIVAFNPNTYTVKVVDKAIVASATWNSTVAKETLLRLNRKWVPKHWMCDYGYGHDLVENLRLYSMKVAPSVGNLHPDAQLKYILETVEFGAIMDVKDPFTKEEVKKTTKAFIVSQTSRLFEPKDGGVAIQFSGEDVELINCLENYKLLNVTARGFEQYGFDKKDGLEDHCVDALMLAIYGIVKYYNELFKRIIYQSVTISSNDAFTPKAEPQKTYVGSIVLLTDNSPEPIYLDERKIKSPEEDLKLPIISRTVDRNGGRRQSSATLMMNRRSGLIKRTF